jgi:16S rRNA (adenine1518-N6/adenine1519-N6)-dimethyltransferase
MMDMTELSQSLANPAAIRRITARHGFKEAKALGQNFIAAPDICPRMAELCGAKNRGALEIGPGFGALTAALAARAEKVVAVELDKRLPPILRETLSGADNVEIVEGDILEMDVAALLSEKFAGLEVVVCANLPYYITSPVVMALLEKRLPIEAVTVMVQKEAAQRLCAQLPSRAAGAVTAAVRWFCEPELLFEGPREAFSPPPDVDYAVILLNVRNSPPVAVKDEAMVFRIVKGAFGQRRKTVLNSLSAFFAVDKPAMARVLAAAGVAAASRAEQLALEDFARIADLIHAETGDS